MVNPVINFISWSGLDKVGNQSLFNPADEKWIDRPFQKNGCRVGSITILFFVAGAFATCEAYNDVVNPWKLSPCLQKREGSGGYQVSSEGFTIGWAPH